jgi:quercetin dioxygenase-like cupin family protein
MWPIFSPVEKLARTFRFDADLGRRITRFGSDFVISRLFHSPDLHVECMSLGPGGLIGMHRASTAQLLAVVEGEGWIRGEDGPKTSISAGGAVFWEQGEMHETGTDSGLVAIVVETAALIDGEAMGPVSKPDRRRTG